MFPKSDLGAAEFASWTEAQRTAEIEKLVAGYRNGLPVGILCKMTEAIAGSQKKARKHLLKQLTPAERQAAVAAASGGMLPVVKLFLG